MYWVIDGACFGAGLAFFVLSIVYNFAYVCFIGLIWIAIYPIILQGLYNLLASCCKRVQYIINPRSNIVFSSKYDITFCGIEKCHPFDSQKYGNIANQLLDRNLLTKQDFIVPSNLPRSLLLQKFSKCYLLKLCYTLPVCSYIEMPLYFLPAFTLRWRLLDPMLTATQGSILAACTALKLKWSINLSGGFHHACFSSGGGFCIYADISLMVHYLRTRFGLRKIMIIDLDAHQGNGHERDMLDDKEVFIVDVYNHHIYPCDQQAKTAISRDIGVFPKTTDDGYLNKLKVIEQDVENFHPQFVIYNAGTDILQGDPLGELNISQVGIIQRDQQIIGMCVKKAIPVAMLLSGGYQKINAEIIANSIENLMQKFK